MPENFEDLWGFMEIVTGEMNYNEDLCILLAPSTGGSKTLAVVLQSQAWPSSQVVHVSPNLKFGQIGILENRRFSHLVKVTSLSFSQGRCPFFPLFQITQGLASPHSKHLYVPTSKKVESWCQTWNLQQKLYQIFWFLYSDEMETMLIKNQNARLNILNWAI